MKGTVVEMTMPGEVVFQEYPLPEPTSHDVLLRVLQTNVCGSEIHIWRGLHPSKKSGVLGHEMVGIIEAMGRDVVTDSAGTPVHVGDRVVPAYFLSCRHCSACLHGHFNLCVNAYAYWSLPSREAPHFHGTFGTHYYVHQDQAFFRVPDAIPDSVASGLNCALSQVLYGLSFVHHANVVLILGAGGLGLMATAICHSRGLTPIVVDRVQRRLEFAQKFGATHTVVADGTLTEHVLQLTQGNGVDAVIDVTGVPATMAAAISMIRLGGQLIEIGSISPGIMTEFDPGLLTRRGVTIVPTMRYQPWFLNQAVDFAMRFLRRYPFEEMTTADTFALTDVKRAMTMSVNHEVMRAAIVPTL